MSHEQQKLNISRNKERIQVNQIYSDQAKIQLIHIPKNSGNDKSRIPNFKLANKAKNTNLRCQQIQGDRRFP